MPDTVATLPEFIAALKAAPDLALVFRADNTDIRTGYHVTELKHVTVNSIDCGGNRDGWGETIVQLLDGAGRGAHLTAAKFNEIAEASLVAIPDLANGRLRFEFAPQNAPAWVFAGGVLVRGTNRFSMDLTPEYAVCKPLQSAACCAA